METEKKTLLSLLDKPVLMMNGEEFLGLLQQVEIPKMVEQQPSVSNHPKLPPFVTGIKGAADVLGISVSTVNRIKADGVLDEAILQHGKTVIFDTYKMLEILRLSNHKTKFNRKQA